MDLERYDSVQLLSFSDVIEIYYMKLRNAMEHAASETKNLKKNGFDGNLIQDDAQGLADFINFNQLPSLSEALAEVLTFMEWQIEKKTPEISETAIYNSLLRLEKATNNTSSWKLFGQDYDGPAFDLSSFEVNMIEEKISAYISSLLKENTSEVLFFPLSDFHSKDTIEKWRILEKISSIKLFASDAVYMQKLKTFLKERLKDEVSSWLNKEMESLKLSSINNVQAHAKTLMKILKVLHSEVTMAMDVTLSELLFKEACSYVEILSKTVDEILYPVCERMMEMMDSYQVQHKDFHVNMRNSCALSHALYSRLKKLSSLLTFHSKKEYSLKLENYPLLFSKSFVNLLQVFKLECHNIIKCAVQDETKDSVHYEEKIFSSTVIVLNCICTTIDESKHFEIDEEEQKIAFLVKVTDIICDGVKIFAESLECRLHTMNTPVKDLYALKKVCILANSTKHALEYLHELPQQMQWSEILDNKNNDASDTGLNDQVLRILKLLHESMNRHVLDIISRMLNAVVCGIHCNIEKVLASWLQSQTPSQVFEKFLCHLCEILELLEENLKKSLFSQLLSSLWSFLIPSIGKEIQEGQPPKYAKTVKKNILCLKDFLLHMNMKELEEHKPLLRNLMDDLVLNSKSTEELQLHYYVQIAESIVSPIEYLGHIAFQAGYKTNGNAFVDLYINVLKGQRLPARKFEMSQLTVKVELCPNILFSSFVPFETAPATEDLDKPVFNELFQFSKLESDILNLKGAAVQLLVFNQDFSYSAEAILLLTQVQKMSNLVSVEFLPVYLMPLRKFDMSNMSYQVLEARSRWDKNAKTFINKRAKLSKSQKKFLPCISGKI